MENLKHMFLAILGAVVVWVILSFLTEDWNTQSLVLFILGIVVGFSAKKKTDDNPEIN